MLSSDEEHTANKRPKTASHKAVATEANFDKLLRLAQHALLTTNSSEKAPSNHDSRMDDTTGMEALASAIVIISATNQTWPVADVTCNMPPLRTDHRSAASADDIVADSSTTAPGAEHQMGAADMASAAAASQDGRYLAAPTVDINQGGLDDARSL